MSKTTSIQFVACLAAMLCHAPCRAADLATPLVPLVDLDAEPNLTGIFKGGLRPWRIWGLADNTCEVRPGLVASFKIAGRIIPPIKAAWEFEFNGNGKIRVVRGYTEKSWNTEEAFKAVAPLETALWGDPKAMHEWLLGYPKSSLMVKLGVALYMKEMVNLKTNLSELPIISGIPWMTPVRFC
jgi:hypothetical protein